jgi:hypothetical protein
VPIEKDVLRSMGHLWRLVVVVYQDFLGRFIRGCHVRCEKGSIHDYTDDLMWFVPKRMGEFAKVLRVVDGKTAEEEGAVSRELFAKSAISLLEGFNGLHDSVKTRGLRLFCEAKGEGDHGIFGMRGSQDALVGGG